MMSSSSSEDVSIDCVGPNHYELECHDIIRGLGAAGINFLAVDFDQTLVDIHTEG